MPERFEAWRGARIIAISAESATPKHMPEPMSCSTSTLWNEPKRGLCIRLFNPMIPMISGMTIAEMRVFRS